MKTSKIVAPLVLALLGVCLPASLRAASPPQLLNYQGQLTDQAGGPQNGTFTMTFTIWDAASGGNQLPAGAVWSETQNVSVTLSIFNVLLGSVTPLPENLFKGGPSDASGPLRFLQLVVNGETLAPRKRISSVAYSIGSSDLEAPGDGIPAAANARDDEFNAPSIDPKWSWVNQGTSTITQQSGYTRLSIPAGASDNLRLRVQTAPSAPFTMTGRFTSGGTLMLSGLALMNSANGRIIGFGHDYNGGARLLVVRYNSVTAGSGVVATDTSRGMAQYFRISVTSTVITFQVSLDGITWSTLATETVSAFLGAVDRIGFMANSVGSQPVETALYWFRVF